MKKILPLFLLVFLASCKHDPIIPEVVVSFSADVAPILSANCGDTGCHGTVNPEEIQLTTYNQVRDLVEPGRPNDSKLYKVMMITSGEDGMPPPDRNRVPDEQIKLIYAWILQGALDN